MESFESMALHFPWRRYQSRGIQLKLYLFVNVDLKTWFFYVQFKKTDGNKDFENCDLRRKEFLGLIGLFKVWYDRLVTSDEI